jgi:hypothetical protein
MNKNFWLWQRNSLCMERLFLPARKCLRCKSRPVCVLR